MLKQEFIDRTGYKPTEQEFEEINTLYMATDDDKDTFCMKWKCGFRVVRFLSAPTLIASMN